MNTRTHRLATTVLAAAAILLFSAPALALNFTVHGYDLGERIELVSGARVWTAELDVSLEATADRIASYCVDLDTHIGVGSYEVRDVLDAHSDASPAGERPRNFAWAGHVMDQYGFKVDLLVNDRVTRHQAITGVQAAIWEGIYEGPVVHRDSLSDGARDVFQRIMDGHLPILEGPSQVVDLAGRQDQVFSNAVPEPSAALIFGLGSVLAGSTVRRRNR